MDCAETRRFVRSDCGSANGLRAPFGVHGLRNAVATRREAIAAMNRINLTTPVFALALAIAAAHGAACGDAGTNGSSLRRPAPSPSAGGDGSIAPNGGTNDGSASQPSP